MVLVYFFGTKPFLRRRFLQHYYGDAFIESHRKLIEVPQISYGGPLIYKSLFLYQRYTKGIRYQAIRQFAIVIGKI